MTSDEESKARAREYVEAVRDASLERATPDKRAAVLGYWNSRGAMFRSLARYTIEAVRGVFPMFHLTVDGLTEAIQELTRKR